jgi:tRNA-guanine family transglycosylase
MIDSGGYSLSSKGIDIMPPKYIIRNQLSLLGDSDVPTIICPLDYPIVDIDLSQTQKDKLITETIANAYELKNLIETVSISSNISPMGIIQGDNSDALQYCAIELLNIGFPIYGIGSLANLYDHKTIITRIKAVTSVIPATKLHIFGISAIETVKFMKKIGIASFDSATSIKSAIYNELIYSKPFRRFLVRAPKRASNYSPTCNRILYKPIPCDCPVCREDPTVIFGVGSSKFTKKRAIHNYFHLKKEFMS